MKQPVINICSIEFWDMKVYKTLEKEKASYVLSLIRFILILRSFFFFFICRYFWGEGGYVTDREFEGIKFEEKTPHPCSYYKAYN